MRIASASADSARITTPARLIAAPVHLDARLEVLRRPLGRVPDPGCAAEILSVKLPESPYLPFYQQVAAP